MSESGTKQTSLAFSNLSAFGGQADMLIGNTHFFDVKNLDAVARERNLPKYLGNILFSALIPIQMALLC